MRDRATGAALAGAASLLILAGMLVSHAWPLWTGKPVWLRVQPVDPRDLFRGDYVILSYPVQQLIVSGAGDKPTGDERSWMLQQPHATVRRIGPGWDEPVRRHDVLYVQLEAKEAAGVPMEHVAVTVSREPVEGAVNLRGLVRWESGFNNEDYMHLSMHYGIDAFFVQQGAGKPIEQAIRDPNKPVFAELRVTPSGQARVKTLIINGEPISE